MNFFKNIGYNAPMDARYTEAPKAERVVTDTVVQSQVQTIEMEKPEGRSRQRQAPSVQKMPPREAASSTATSEHAGPCRGEAAPNAPCTLANVPHTILIRYSLCFSGRYSLSSFSSHPFYSPFPDRSSLSSLFLSSLSMLSPPPLYHHGDTYNSKHYNHNNREYNYYHNKINNKYKQQTDTTYNLNNYTKR